MSDILDVMNIKSFPQKKKIEKEPTPFQTTSHQSISEMRQIYAPEEYASQNKRRKLSAMNRELYNLIGSNIPPMAIDTQSISNAGESKKFKEKLVSAKKDAPWRYLGFKNSARNDDLILHHWTRSQFQGTESLKSSETPNEETEVTEEKSEVEEETLDLHEYRYAKYNKKLNIPTFTREEYEQAVNMEEDRNKKELEEKLTKEKIKQEKDETDKTTDSEQRSNKEATKSVKHIADGESKDKATNIKSENPESATGSKDTSPQQEETVKITDTVNADESKLEEPKSEESKLQDSEPKEAELEEAEPEETESTETESKEIESKELEPEEPELEASKPEGPKERIWTYEETKYLFDLCTSLDMRWAVIYDTYQDKYSDRSLEDLKVQMYTTSANILEKRGNPNDSALIKSLRQFNKDKEISRKFYLAKLIHRQPTEIAEEESLVIEARKFELAAKKMLYERGQLLQLLDSPQSSAPVNQYLTSQGLTQLYNSLMASDKGKKRKAEAPVAPLLGPNAIPHTQHISMSGAGAQISGNKRRMNQAVVNTSTSKPNANNTSNNDKNPSKLTEVQQLLHKTLTTEELEVYGIEIHNDRLQPGVHVRSQKIASFKPSVQAKVHEILGQLGMSVKPNVPTGPVSKKFDELLNKISHLVDLKKQSDKLLAEIELIKRQKGL